MSKNRLLAVAACAAVFVGVGASAALAGEVKGPPTGGTPTTNNTGAEGHARSLCSFSGLNDYINGQSDRQTQTPKDAAPGSAAHGGFFLMTILYCNPTIGDNGVVPPPAP